MFIRKSKQAIKKEFQLVRVSFSPFMNKFYLFLIYFSTCFYTAKAAVEPPNYEFSIETLQLFMPDQKFDEIQKKYQKYETLYNKNGFKILKFNVEQIRYKFPVLVQFKNDIVTDMHARLPTYFLHNIFHQTLINKLGAQDLYKKIEEQALYIWKNKQNLKHSYFGSCTITCFPVYYSVEKVDHEFGSQYQSIINRLNENELKTAKPSTP